MAIKQESLFGEAHGPYGADLAPRAKASRDDPETSHQAAQRHENSGIAKTNRDIALALVKRKPGMTYIELFDKVANDEERVVLRNPTELMKRLGDLKDKLIRHGPKKECSVRGTSMVTWEPIE